jgi:hypothetical protein
MVPAPRWGVPGPFATACVPGGVSAAAERDGQLAVLAHRVAGVDREIEEDLLKLRRIGLHPQAPVLIDIEIDIDGRRHKAAGHGHRLLNDRSQFDRLAARRRRPGEGQECAGRLACLFGGDGDLLKARCGRVVLFERDERETEVAVDGGEGVVDVVSDAAGELADGFHLPALVNLLGQPGPIGDILDRDARAGRLAVGPADRLCRDEELGLCPVILRRGDPQDRVHRLARTPLEQNS